MSSSLQQSVQSHLDAATLDPTKPGALLVVAPPFPAIDTF